MINTTLGNNHIFFNQFFRSISNNQLDELLNIYAESTDDEGLILYSDRFNNVYKQEVSVDEFYQELLNESYARYGNGID